jgi:hypothetical protein
VKPPLIFWNKPAYLDNPYAGVDLINQHGLTRVFFPGDI